MALKSFGELFSETDNDEIEGEFIVYDSQGENKQNCYACKDNKQSRFFKPLKLNDEVIVDCAKCKMPNSFPLDYKCEKISKKEAKT